MRNGNEALEREARRLGLNLGSNAWAVSPQRSATGHALLQAMPSLGRREVPPLYEIHLKGAPAQTMTVFETVHGPVIAWDDEKGRAVSRKRAGYGDLKGVVDSMLGIMEAQDLPSFREAASKSPKSLNYIYADDEGNIAHFHTGRQMRRARGHSGTLPIPGTGQYESNGLIPWPDMPRSINPKRGYIAAANNQPGTGYADQFALYRDRAFKPMPYTKADIRKYAESEITLWHTGH